ncbi:hypothetical protein RIF29_04140 [Crotalaria pallida]|uniref:Uncharacterized protein n=1 Tax=Crotalaria pallida TaxID=3830 RepID=A0AAN9P9W2_CROPI
MKKNITLRKQNQNYSPFQNMGRFEGKDDVPAAAVHEVAATVHDVAAAVEFWGVVAAIGLECGLVAVTKVDWGEINYFHCPSRCFYFHRNDNVTVYKK